ncbi:unnamed protein product, partial [Allacma fusca]
MVSNKIISTDDIIIGPNKRKVFNLDMNAELAENESILILPTQTFHNIAGIRLITNKEETGEWKLELHNYTNIPQRIYATQQIGQVHIIKQAYEMKTDVIKTTPNEKEFSANDEVRDNEGNIINISKNLKTEDRLRVIKLVEKYKHLFTMNSLEVSKANVDEYELKVRDDEPVASRSYKLAPVERREIWRQINAMVKAGILRRSKSNYCAPAFLVK